MNIRVVALPNLGSCPLPRYETSQSAGMDVRAAIPEAVVLEPCESITLPLGFKIEIPAGFEAQIRPRSGLARKHKITVLNAPGTIDGDYRDEVAVILINHSDTPFTINPGDRVAQMVIAPVVQATLVQVEELTVTDRSGGFGSTGQA